jgi:hypothetical protein
MTTRTRRLLLINLLSFITVFISVMQTDMFGQGVVNKTNSDGGISGVKKYAEEELVIEIRKENGGKTLVAEKVPGKPPEVYRSPQAKIPNSSKTLSNVPAYSWSFGCSATSASMIAGYYDNRGYWKIYTGPSNGGAAPMNNSEWGYVVLNGERRALCPISASRMGLDGRTIKGHVDDYWIKSDNCDKDPYITGGWTEHALRDCVGDYMKTNQSAFSNCDGATTFYYYDSGELYNGSDVKDGLYGFEQFCRSKGYNVTLRYNQRIKGFQGNAAGFTFEQYKQEIDNGYPVFIQVLGHTMVGVGYSDDGNKVYLHDTWDYSLHEMPWGGQYAGLQHRGVSVIHLAPVDTTKYIVTVNANPSSAAVVYGAGSFFYQMPDTASFTANPGYTFKFWSENGAPVSGEPKYIFGVSKNRNLLANFERDTYTVSASSVPADGGTIKGTGSLVYGQTDTLYASANKEYVFDRWTENGAFVSYSPMYIFTVTSNRSLQANFTKKRFTVTTSGNPITAGVTIGGGGFSYGDTCTIKASPNLGYTFENWAESGVVVSTTPVYSFTVTSNRNFVANFTKIVYTVTTLSNPLEGGYTAGGGGVQYGKTDTVYAVPNNGYKFVNWTESGVIVSATPAYWFTVNGSRILTANFSKINYAVNVSANPGEGGVVKGGGSYFIGDTATVEAVSNKNFTFLAWVENDAMVSPKAGYSFIVNSNRNLTAVFGGVFLNSLNGGEILNAEDSTAILWQSYNVASLVIELTTNNGLSWLPIENNYNAASGRYNWKIPPVNSQACKIRVSDILKPAISAQSKTTFTITAGKVLISGRLVYGNAQETPVSNTGIYLVDNGLIADSAVTSQDGGFSLFGDKNKKYGFKITVNKIHNGANSTDALLIARHFVFGSQLSPLQQKAADVDCNSVINNTDALMIIQKSVGHNVAFKCGDWVNDAPEFISSGNDSNTTIHSLAAGDVNASYDFSISKESASYRINFSPLANRAYKEICAPVYITSPASIGALTAVLKFDESKFSVTGISSKLAGIQYSVSDGNLKLGWANPEPTAVNTEEPLFVITIKLSGGEEAAFDIGAETEFADKEGKTLGGLRLKAGVENSNVLTDKEILANYPNPFNPSTTIRFTVKQTENVSVVIYNLLGKEVIKLVDEVKKPGAYNVNWLGADKNGNRVPSGVYIYRLICGNEITSRKMALLK